MEKRKLTEEEKKIVEDNEKLIYSFCHSNGLNVNEYYDILAIELCNCVMKWDRKRSISVLLYRYFKNAVYSYWIYNNAKKRDWGKQFNFTYKDNDEQGEFCVTDNSVDVESFVVAKDLIKIINSNDVWRLYVSGYKQWEISKLLNMSARTVSINVNKLKMEVENYYNEGNTENFN